MVARKIANNGCFICIGYWMVDWAPKTNKIAANDLIIDHWNPLTNYLFYEIKMKKRKTNLQKLSTSPHATKGKI